MAKHSTKNTDLQFGEAYRTTKMTPWSKYDKYFTAVEVPEDELLLFRSFLPVKGKPGVSLALFVWLKKKETICMTTSDTECIFYVKHVGWEDRHISVITNQVVDDKPKEVN